MYDRNLVSMFHNLCIVRLSLFQYLCGIEIVLSFLFSLLSKHRNYMLSWAKMALILDVIQTYCVFSYILEWKQWALSGDVFDVLANVQLWCYFQCTSRYVLLIWPRNHNSTEICRSYNIKNFLETNPTFLPIPTDLAHFQTINEVCIVFNKDFIQPTLLGYHMCKL